MAKQALTKSNQSAKRYERIIQEILRRSSTLVVAVANKQFIKQLDWALYDNMATFFLIRLLIYLVECNIVLYYSIAH